MKNATPFFKRMFLAAFVLVILQGCNPTSPTSGDPTPVNLNGKIKNSKYFISQISDTFYVNYIYDSTGRVEQINSNYGTALFQRLSVSYESGIIVVQNTQAQVNPISKQIFYMHLGTDWVDSTDIYYNTHLSQRIIAMRDNSNKLISLRTFAYDTLGNRSFFSGLDTIIFNGNNISICSAPVNSLNTILGGYVKSLYEYDLSKTIKSNTTCGKYMICNILWPLSILDINTNIDVLGISMGIINENIIIKETNEPHYLFAPNQIDIVDHIYTLFNEDEIEFTTNSSITFGDHSYVYNAYY